MADITMVEAVGSGSGRAGTAMAAYEVEIGVSDPDPGFNVVWAERWDEEDDCADGACRDCGHAVTAAGVRGLVAEAEAAGLAGKWPGRAWVTDAYGRRSGAPEAAAA